MVRAAIARPRCIEATFRTGHLPSAFFAGS
jgi:hypothetical protein